MVDCLLRRISSAPLRNQRKLESICQSWLTFCLLQLTESIELSVKKQRILFNYDELQARLVRGAPLPLRLCPSPLGGGEGSGGG